MAEFPALPFWTDAYLADTTHLSTAEHGAYLLLLMASWRRPNCDLPDDDAYLARICRADGRTWKRSLRPSLEPFFVIADGFWLQKRLRNERKHVAERSTKMRSNVLVRWNKNNHIADTEVSSNSVQTRNTHTHTHIHKKIYPNVDEAGACPTCGGQLPDPAKGIISKCTCPGNPEWRPKLVALRS